MKIRYCTNCLHVMSAGISKKDKCCGECTKSLRGICLVCDGYVEGGILCMCNRCYAEGNKSILNRKLTSLQKDSDNKELINRAVKYFSRFNFADFDIYEVRCEIKHGNIILVYFKESELIFTMESNTDIVKISSDTLIAFVEIFENIQPLIDYVGKKHAKP